MSSNMQLDSAQASAGATAELIAPQLARADRPRGWYRRFGRMLLTVARFFWAYVVAMACTQYALLAVLLVGWTARLTQRAIFKRWWRAGRSAGQGIEFAELLESLEGEGACCAGSPNWIVRNDRRLHALRCRDSSANLLRRAGWLVSDLVHSLWLNAKIGVQVLVNTWVFTLPGCVFMTFSWAFGWNNSFYKGYEQAHVGPAMGFFGIGLFIAAMMYVPMATARQAATGQWKSFYEFSTVVRLIKRRAFPCAVLAGLFALAAMPVNILKTAPGLFSSGEGAFAHRVEAMTAEEARAFLQSYFFWSSAALVMGYVALRWWAGRIYASALLAEVRFGRRMPSLAPAERAVLARLGLLERNTSKNHPLIRAIGWTASRTGLVVAGLLMGIFWFVFIGQVYVSEFLTYHTEFGQAWLNHPLVQLPLFKYIPSALRP